MGNQHNLSSENKKKLVQNINVGNANRRRNAFLEESGKSYLEIITKESSSYKGIKTINNNDSDRGSVNNTKDSKDKATELTTNCSSITTNTFMDLSSGKVPTYFEWLEPAGVVYLTGSFSNWAQWFMMSKKSNGKFELMLV